MKITIVAMDVGPSKALTLVAQTLEDLGHSVSTFFGMGQPFPEGTPSEIIESVNAADRVLIGLSSTAARATEEILAAKTAIARGVPFGFFCCTYGEFRRPWFEGVLAEAHFLFTINEGDAEEASRYAPRAHIVASGNPDWATYFAPKTGSKEVRKRLDVGPEDLLILSVGSKEVDRNTNLWHNLVLATNRIDRQIILVIARHPGEQNAIETYDWIGETSVHRVVFLETMGMNSNEALAGADVVVSSISSVGIAAACQLIPVIDHISMRDSMWWEKLSGSPEWPPVTEGASRETNNSTGLENLIRLLSYRDSDDVRGMRERQKAAFSYESVANASKQIAEALVRD